MVWGPLIEISITRSGTYEADSTRFGAPFMLQLYHSTCKLILCYCAWQEQRPAQSVNAGLLVLYQIILDYIMLYYI